MEFFRSNPPSRLAYFLGEIFLPFFFPRETELTGLKWRKEKFDRTIRCKTLFLVYEKSKLFLDE